MISNNQKKVQEKKIHNKVGGMTHQSRFGAIEREIRSRKLIVCPSVNTGKSIKFEQAWNRQSEKKDLVRITLGKEVIICERDFLEQTLATMSQGDELLKFTAPTIAL